MAEREEETKQRVPVPLLKAYLRKERGDPPHVPGWIMPTAWIASVSLFFVLKVSMLGFWLFAFFVGLPFILAYYLRQRYTPRNTEEKVDEIHYGAIKKLKALVDDGMERRLPPGVLRKLEQAVGLYNTRVAQLTVEAQPDVEEQIASLRRVLHGCFVVATTVMRDEHCSKREWKAILENYPLVNGVEDAIDAHLSRLREPALLNPERLAALRELETFDTSEELHIRTRE
jgi:hypothetical protein